MITELLSNVIYCNYKMEKELGEKNPQLIQLKMNMIKI